jgi:uncharacterized protein YkwD
MRHQSGNTAVTKTSEPAPIIPHPEPGWALLSDEEKQFIAELDRLREKLGLPQIIVEEQIVADSRRWSRHMNKVKRLYHGSSQENCAVGYETGVSTFRQWRNSAGHNAKLCSSSDRVCGIGVDGKYWTYRAAPSMGAYRTGTVPAESND